MLLSQDELQTEATLSSLHPAIIKLNFTNAYIPRIKEEIIIKHLKPFPCVALLGSRQVGKSTLAKHIISSFGPAIYLDLEDPRDLVKLQDHQDLKDLVRQRIKNTIK
jgi:predicted AAA+ superfamily ATPase